MQYILVPGKPIEWKRVARKTGQSSPFDSQKRFKKDFILQARPQIKEKIPARVPVAMGFKFCFKRPKSHYKSGSKTLKPNTLLKPESPTAALSSDA